VNTRASISSEGENVVKTFVNPFTAHLEYFFYPLAYGFEHGQIAGLDMVDRDYMVLGRLFYTLATVGPQLQ